MKSATNLRKLQVRKLIFSLTHAACWPALMRRVVPAIEHMPVLRRLGVDGIIDVGANRGQFTFACRLAQPQAPILAFEPIPHEARIFREVHGHCTGIQLIESALGEIAGTATLHLSKSADSSSLLAIGQQHTVMFQNTEEIGTLPVPVQRLDQFSEYWKGRSRQLLKLDVQGFELQVLRGAVETLETCAYVYAECSEIALYDGQALRPEVEVFLRAHGFAVEGNYNAMVKDDGQVIHADYLFIKTPSGPVA